MDKDVKITVITVSLNAVKTIEQTLLSVLNQGYSNLEYIIIDGGSTDGTLTIIDRYRESLALVVSEPDDGIYSAFKKGLRHASGDLSGFERELLLLGKGQILLTTTFKDVPVPVQVPAYDALCDISQGR